MALRIIYSGLNSRFEILCSNRRKFSLHAVPVWRLRMSGSRSHPAMDLSSNPLLEASFDPENPGRFSLDPSMMRAQSEANRAQTPVPGLGYSIVRKMKMKYDTGVKVINLVRRTLELATDAAVDEAHLSEVIGFLLDAEVKSYLV
jgi:hypothetical protein